MYQEVIDGFSSEVRAELFRRMGVPAKPQDLHGFENFVFGFGDRVVRVSHESHRSVSQLSGELDFLEMLVHNGAPVAAPIRLVGGNYLESLNGYHACLFQKATGIRAEPPYPPELIELWGQAIGLFHRLATGFSSEKRRPDWKEDNNHQFHERIPEEQFLVRQRAGRLLQTLESLPVDDSVFGLIHSDAHPGNFLVQDKQLTFFDFDDCLYAWFGYDLATILFGIALQADGQDREKAICAFLGSFLQGYARSHNVDALLLQFMPQLIALREFSFYGVVHAFMDPENLEYESARIYMQGRRTLLEQGVPLIDIDFSRFG